jgi:flagellar capping protein FliD
VNADALESALADDPIAARQLLGGDGVSEGLAAALAQDIARIVDSDKRPHPNDPNKFIEYGLLPARAVAFERRIDVLTEQIERLELRLEKREELLVAQFARMETLITQLREQGNSLSSLSVLRMEER